VFLTGMEFKVKIREFTAFGVTANVFEVEFA
jgi:hypothetical protein